MALLTFMGKAASALIHTVFSIITRFIVLRENRTILSCANHFLFFFCFQHKSTMTSVKTQDKIYFQSGK